MKKNKYFEICLSATKEQLEELNISKEKDCIHCIHYEKCKRGEYYGN